MPRESRLEMKGISVLKGINYGKSYFCAESTLLIPSFLACWKT